MIRILWTVVLTYTKCYTCIHTTTASFSPLLDWSDASPMLLLLPKRVARDSSDADVIAGLGSGDDVDDALIGLLAFKSENKKIVVRT